MFQGYTTQLRVLFQDVVFSLLSSLLSILFVRWLSSPQFGFTTSVLVWLGFSLCGSVVGAGLSGSSRVIKRYTTGVTLHRVLLLIVIKELVTSSSFLIVPSLFKSFSTTEHVLLLLTDGILTSLFLLYFRWVARQVRMEHDEVASHSGRQSALIRGTSPSAVELLERLEREGEYDVVAFLTDRPEMSGRILEGKPVYWCVDSSRLEEIRWMFGGIDAVLYPREPMASAEERCPVRPGMTEGESVMTVVSSDASLLRDRMPKVQYLVKRTFDTLLSAILLVVFSPLLALCAIAVKLEDGGPVIYSQERIGRGGKPFHIYKLRSMRMDAEQGRPALCQGEEDDRLTKVGRFFRQHHLDELPQLYNVLRGDMSFIGYRPERQYYIDKIMARDPRYRYLYQIRPGVTSYATLYNGYTDSLEKMLRRLDLDLYYLRNHSLLFDAKVLGLTFLSIVGGRKF